VMNRVVNLYPDHKNPRGRVQIRILKTQRERRCIQGLVSETLVNMTMGLFMHTSCSQCTSRIRTVMENLEKSWNFRNEKVGGKVMGMLLYLHVHLRRV